MGPDHFYHLLFLSCIPQRCFGHPLMRTTCWYPESSHVTIGTGTGIFSKLHSYSGTIFALCNHLCQKTLLASSRCVSYSKSKVVRYRQHILVCSVILKAATQKVWLKDIKAFHQSTMISHHQKQEKALYNNNQLYAKLPHLQQASSSLQNHQSHSSSHSSQNNVLIPTLPFWRIRSPLPSS